MRIIESHNAAISRRAAPELCCNLTLLKYRGRREGRVPAAPMARVRKKSTRQNHRYAGHPAFPAQWLYGLLRALPGDRRSCPRFPRQRECIARGISTGMPGPHGLTVRIVLFVRMIRSRCNPTRPPHPTSTSVTIAKRPSGEAGQQVGNHIFPKNESRFFSQHGSRWRTA
jgi:hypothetical protein